MMILTRTRSSRFIALALHRAGPDGLKLEQLAQAMRALDWSLLPTLGAMIAFGFVRVEWRPPAPKRYVLTDSGDRWILANVVPERER